MDYQKFLEGKRKTAKSVGFDIDTSIVNPILFEFQRDIVKWAVKRGRAAIFADCGLGKTFMQIEWARIVGGRCLILAPLCVAQQTIEEGAKLGVQIHYTRSGDDLIDGINIANYEMLHAFDPSDFYSLVLDESSILKNYAGKYRQEITQFAKGINYRLACTATPAPNDLIEIINHAEFLDVMSGKEIIAMYFIQDGNTTHKWRLKHHAVEGFWQWMASWSVALRRPSDLGYDDDGYILPALNFISHVVKAHTPLPGKLFVEEAATLNERRDARRESLDDRVARVASLVNGTNEPWICWCDLNIESEALCKAIPDAIEVTGSMDFDTKEERLWGFTQGKYRVLVTKPSIAGFGMNWQHCANVAFTGLSDSYEQFYQAIRRCWRFGQNNTVDCHIVTGEAEGAVTKNIKRKELQAAEMFDKIVTNMKGFTEVHQMSTRDEMKIETATETGDNWTMMLGDCIDRIKDVESNSIGLSVFSPPFPGMYTYSNTSRDIGNCASIEELQEHISHLYPELLRVMKPGRSVCIHLTQMVTFKYLDGYSGMKDFRGKTIEAMERAGFHYYGEVCIDKDPQVKAIRTKDAGLLFKSLATDSSKMHMALADYILQFKKPGDNEEPIRAGISDKYGNSDGWITADEWIEWAAPVWYRQTKDYPGGIRETDVLNVRVAKDGKDEKHLCPLQLGVIERCVKLWSNPGDTVLSPFAGIGSEGYESLRHRRKFIGIELKRSYFDVAVDNLKAARPADSGSLAAIMEESNA